LLLLSSSAPTPFPYTTLFRSRGIIQQRRTIADSYPPGTNLVTLDDDVTGLERLTPDGRGLRPLPDLHGFFQSMFERTREERLTRSEEHTSELQSRFDLVCRLL